MSSNVMSSNSVKIAYDDNRNWLVSSEPLPDPHISGRTLIAFGLSVVVAPLVFSHFEFDAESMTIFGSTDSGGECIEFPAESEPGRELTALGLVEGLCPSPASIATIGTTETACDFPALDLLLYWISERLRILERKESGAPPPWTDDKIFQDWSFCNVRREDDKTSRWISEHWRTPHADDPDLWFSMLVARYVNRIDTLAELDYPVPWDAEHFLSVMKARQDRGVQQYGHAYIIAGGRNGTGLSKPDYQVQQIFNPLWRDRERIRPQPGWTLETFVCRLGQYRGVGDGFMAGQITADAKYVAPLSEAGDWWTFCVSGPGSRRGLYRVLGRPLPPRFASGKQEAPMPEYEWRREVRKLQVVVNQELERLGIAPLHAQDLQNVLCELDKYLRVKNGEGTPKARYPHT